MLWKDVLCVESVVLFSTEPWSTSLEDTLVRATGRAPGLLPEEGPSDYGGSSATGRGRCVLPGRGLRETAGKVRGINALASGRFERKLICDLQAYFSD